MGIKIICDECGRVIDNETYHTEKAVKKTRIFCHNCYVMRSLENRKYMPTTEEKIRKIK
ncbi:MAG: hypothetical protein ACOCQD_03200 [archaeon]